MKMKLLLMSCVLGLVAGCKIAIIVPSGGDVVSSNAAHNCAEGNVCEFEINTGQLPFSETLTAIPKAGYVFEKWSDGGEFQCAKSTNPTCTINIADDYLASLVVSLFDSGYAMPIFKDIDIDTDGDGIFDRQDEDDDNDGTFDVDDNCPLDATDTCIYTSFTPQYSTNAVITDEGARILGDSLDGSKYVGLYFDNSPLRFDLFTWRSYSGSTAPNKGIFYTGANCTGEMLGSSHSGAYLPREDNRVYIPDESKPTLYADLEYYQNKNGGCSSQGNLAERVYYRLKPTNLVIPNGTLLFWNL